MPWLPLLAPELPLFVTALFGTLVVIAGSYLLGAIADHLPNVGIPFTSITFRDIFRSIIDPVRAALLGIFIGLFRFVEGWLRAPAYNATTGAAKTLAAVWHHATFIQYLWGHAIPASARAAVNTAAGYTDDSIQAVRAQIHAAEVTWANHHTYTDAQAYIKLEQTAPSVAHAFLAAQATTMLASFAHAQDLHDQLRDYIGRSITGQADVALPYTGQTLIGVSGAIAIPGPVDLNNVDVQDIIKTGSQIAVGTAVAVIATKIVECLVSKCAGNNNFDNLLKDALGLLAAAEFAGFVEQFVKSPEATIASYTAPFAAAYQGGAASVSDVWGDIEKALGL